MKTLKGERFLITRAGRWAKTGGNYFKTEVRVSLGHKVLEDFYGNKPQRTTYEVKSYSGEVAITWQSNRETPDELYAAKMEYDINPVAARIAAKIAKVASHLPHDGLTPEVLKDALDALTVEFTSAYDAVVCWD